MARLSSVNTGAHNPAEPLRLFGNSIPGVSRGAAMLFFMAVNCFTLFDYDLGVMSPVGNAMSLAGLIIVGGSSRLSRVLGILPVISFAGFQVLSTLWSLEPDVTLKYSLELLYTAFVGLTFAVYARPEGIVKSILFGGGVAVLLSIVSGKQGPSMEGPVLIGVMGSKNALAETSQLVFQCALGVLAFSGQSLWTRLAALLLAAPACFVALTVHASTATVALFGASTAFLLLLLASRATVGVRLAFLVFLALAIGLAALVWDDITSVLADFSLRVLKKDSTLTGRTVLWDFARSFISERPLLGRGYKEVWLGHSADTIGLLRWAGISDGKTFFFHQTFLDAAVDSGYVGAGILVITYLYLLSRSALRVLLNPTAGWLLMFTVVLTIVVESFFGTVVQPLSLTTVLIFGLSGSLALAARGDSSRARASHGARNPSHSIAATAP